MLKLTVSFVVPFVTASSFRSPNQYTPFGQADTQEGSLPSRKRSALNRHFEMVPFENLAQFSIVNSIIIKDFDKDGFDDLLLAGNFYSSEVEAIRSDAGTGIWLRGDGNGNFKAIPNSLSGLYIDGDVKDIEKIRVKGAEVLLTAKNRDYMQLIKPGNK